MGSVVPSSTMDALADNLEPPGDRIPMEQLPEAPAPAPRSSLDDLDAVLADGGGKRSPLPKKKRSRKKKAASEDEPLANPSSMEMLTSGNAPLGGRIRPPEDDDEEEIVRDVPDSTMDDLFAHTDDTEPRQEKPPGYPPLQSNPASRIDFRDQLTQKRMSGGALHLSPDASSRMVLRPGPQTPEGASQMETLSETTSRMALRHGPKTQEGAAPMGALMVFESPAGGTGGGTGGEADQDAGEVGVLPDAASRMILRPGPQTPEGASKMEALSKTTSRMELRPGSKTQEGAAQMEALMVFKSPAGGTGGKASGEADQDAGEVGVLPDAASRMVLRPGPQTPEGASQMETLSETTSRMELRPGSKAHEGAAPMEALMVFESPAGRASGKASGEADQDGGEVEILPDAASRMILRPGSKTPEGASKMEALSETTSRMELRPGSKTQEGAAQMEALMVFESPAGGTGGRTFHSPPGASSPSDIPVGSGGRMPLTKTPKTDAGTANNELSRLVDGPPLPRLNLPVPKKRTRPVPDGKTPILPERIPVQVTLAPSQKCPKKNVTPEKVGESAHERLEFRYNRFTTLVIRQPTYFCPGCPDVEPFIGKNPAFAATRAPVGNGMLARIALALYLDRLPTGQLISLIEGLDVVVHQQTILHELSRIAARLAPVVEVMKGDAKSSERPMPALVDHHRFDVIGTVQARYGKGHVVFTFTPDAMVPPGGGEAAPISETVRGRWRQQGRAGRWAALRQRLFLSLLVDPDRARSGLFLLENMPPTPDVKEDKAELERFEAWLERAFAEIDIPTGRFQRAVSATKAMWPLLLEDTAQRKRHRPGEDPWVFDETVGDIDAVMIWLSLIESCLQLQAHPWEYLNAVLGELGVADRLDPKAWTPRAWLRGG
ncbi:MAG: hypothetical protein AAFV53_34590 [Myxococcota bacterium]